MSKILATAVALIAALLMPAAASAVTRREMEKAQATAILWYLRYENNGSDYLEKLNPANVAELEKSLKATEKENIKAAKAIALPTDYASWDKARLVEYWSSTFFESKSLTEKGKGARGRVKTKLQAMEIAAPATAAEEAPASPAEDPAAIVEAAPETPVESPADGLPGAEEIIARASDSADVATVTTSATEDGAKKSGNSSTWIYVVALIVLIGVVVWLVVFASKTMQGSSSDEDDSDKNSDKDSGKKRKNVKAPSDYELEDVEVDVDDEPEELVRVGAPAIEGGDAKLREKFARALSAKDEEIRSLHREIHDLRDECLKLGEENGRLNSDLTVAQRELNALQGRLKAASAVTSAASAVNAAPARRKETPAEGSGEKREIYLGRVNNKGVFVRADRNIVAEKTVYLLSTTDGYTGSYRVVQNEEVVSRALDNPEYYLAGGCVASDILDTDEAEGIRTISPGTAIFEEGCWRVLRKSKISYL